MKRSICAGFLVASLSVTSVGLRATAADPADVSPAPVTPTKPATPPRPETPPRPTGPMTLGDRVKAAAAEVGLSDEQRTKLDALVAEVMKKAEALRDEQGPEARRKLAALRDETIDKVKALLSDEQFKKFQDAMGRVGQAAGARLGAALQRFQEAAKQLDLNDEQKARLRSVFEEARKTFEELRPQLQGGPATPELREKMRAAVEAMRTKVQDALTPEQREKLGELMRQPGQGRPQQERPKGDQ